MAILVTGATGYIGSHTCIALLQSGFSVVGIDNFSNSKPEVIPKIEEISGKSFTFYQGDVCDKQCLRQIFSQHTIEGVIHFAGAKAVGESVAKPLYYYENNVGSTIALAQVMEEFSVYRMVFSSSATVYGEAKVVPIPEDAPLSTSNPYGTTKLMIEGLLTEWATSNPKVGVSLLRYFNPVGAHPSGLIGEDPNGIPNNLMPYICRVAEGKLPQLTVFGNDYDTPDGTGVRDYIHVVDLAKGHIDALNRLLTVEGVEIYNLGSGKGLSVLELVEAFKQVNNIDVPYVIGPRRPGDVTIYCADPTKANTVLGWYAKQTTEDICRDSWNYIQQSKKEK